MSEERKVRSELRQGLHQFLMQLYHSYLTSHSEQNAKQLVSEAIKEQYELFTEDSLASHSVVESISNKLNELQELLEQEKSYDGQMFYAEQVDTLNAAIDILKR